MGLRFSELIGFIKGVSLPSEWHAGVIWYTMLLAYSKVGWATYPIVLCTLLLSMNRIRIGRSTLLVTVLAIGLVAFKLLFGSSPLAALLLFKYFFGFLVFVWYFQLPDAFRLFNPRKLLIVLSLFVVAEAILINSFFTAADFPNYPDFVLAPSHKTAYFGFYQRAYGFGGSATITSTLLVALMFLARARGQLSKRVQALTFTAILLAASGTGILLLSAFLFTGIRSLRIRFCAFVIAVLLYGVLFSQVQTDFNSPWARLTVGYFGDLINMKLGQLTGKYSIFNETFDKVLFGATLLQKEELPFWDDFGLGTLLYCFGLLGGFLYVFSAVLFRSRWALSAVAILYLGMVHYGGLFSIPGQMILGYCFASALNCKRAEILGRPFEESRVSV